MNVGQRVALKTDFENGEYGIIPKGTTAVVQDAIGGVFNEVRFENYLLPDGYYDDGIPENIGYFFDNELVALD